MMHKLHVLQYPGLGNASSPFAPPPSPIPSPSRRHSLALSHSHTLTATHARALSCCWKLECRLEVLLIGCEAAVASPVYTGLEGGQHQPHVVCMAPSFGICQRGERILKHIHAWTNTATHTHARIGIQRPGREDAEEE